MFQNDTRVLLQKHSKLFFQIVIYHELNIFQRKERLSCLASICCIAFVGLQVSNTTSPIVLEKQYSAVVFVPEEWTVSNQEMYRNVTANSCEVDIVLKILSLSE